MHLSPFLSLAPRLRAAALSAYATEVMDGVLRIANETRQRVEVTTAKTDTLVQALERAAGDVQLAGMDVGAAT